jgi:hypothetical protein
MEQLDGSPSDIEDLRGLVDARTDGLIEWEFLPFNADEFEEIAPETLSGDLHRVARGPGERGQVGAFHDGRPSSPGACLLWRHPGEVP